MEDKTISGLTFASALTGAELVEVVQGGVNKQSTTQAIANLGGGVESVTGSTVDSTDPANPVVNADAAGAAATAQSNAQTYADGKVAQTITNGITTSAPSQDAVFDALAGKETAGAAAAALTAAQAYADGKVVQTVTNGVTSTAPSQDAVFDFVNGKIVAYGIALSDLVTPITSGITKGYFRMPHAMVLTAVRASLKTAQYSGSLVTVDINESGNSILSTKITIDNNEKTSVTAVTAPVISDANLADDAEITFDIDLVGDGSALGLVVWIIGTKTV